MEFLVDPKGTWSRWPSENLAAQLGYPRADFDLAGYLARNLGYVWLVVLPEYTLVQFRAGMLSPATVSAVEPFLNNAAKSTPVGLVFYSMGWMEEVFVEPEAIGPRLRELASLREPKLRDLYIRREHNPAHWSQTQRSSLSGLFGLWRERNGMFDERAMEFLATSDLNPRTVLMEPHRDRGLQVVYSGAGFTAYDSYSLSNTVGHGIEDQPDKAYGNWARQFYDSCLQSGGPIIDDVDAIIEQPDHDPRRRRYQRLILRWQRPDGAIVLSGSSILNPPYLSIPLDCSA